MSQTLTLRKALKSGIFFAVCLGMTACYSLTTIPVNKIPADIKILVIHAEDNTWTTTGYSITDGILTAHLGADSIKLKRGNNAHVYAAPLSAVTIDGQTLTVPVRNIAKADFSDLDSADTIGFGALWALIIMTALLFLG